mgnify:CR=1 FL=1
MGFKEQIKNAVLNYLEEAAAMPFGLKVPEPFRRTNSAVDRTVRGARSAGQAIRKSPRTAAAVALAAGGAATALGGGNEAPKKPDPTAVERPNVDLNQSFEKSVGIGKNPFYMGNMLKDTKTDKKGKWQGIHRKDNNTNTTDNNTNTTKRREQFKNAVLNYLEEQRAQAASNRQMR